jgi:GT2 family glycosyltransferase
MIHIPLGLMESVTPFRVSGWAFDRAHPKIALDLVLRVDGLAVDWFRPNAHIPAIADYLGWEQDRLGLIGFNVSLPEWVADGAEHTIDVVVAATGTLLRATTNTVCYRPVHHRLEHASPSSAPPRPGKASTAKVLTKSLTNAVPAVKPQVSVLVLNRNGKALLGHLFDSWLRHNQTVPVEWIVVDHASTDGSLALLKDWQGRLALQVIALDYNDSFSASCNRAAAVASGEFLLFLNNDIIWLHDALPSMLDTLRDASVAAVGMKLLKLLGNETYARPGNTTVQHLGVRYLQHQVGYFPYEITPSQHNQENEFGSQETPAVTAAAMLCRKADFEAAGRFDTQFFYGFEDVELCLRLRHRLGKRIICRNDLTALHRHGHTRLTGRETGQFDRIQHNAHVLDSMTGLWAKSAWWNSLLSADGLMCAEPLTVGLVVDEAPHTTTGRLHQWAQRQGDAIVQTHRRARVVLVHPGVDSYDVRSLHVLVVASADYDITRLRYVRPDLMVLAWVRGPLAAWLASSWWMSFHGYVAPTAAREAELLEKASIHAEQHSPQQPLGRYLVPHQWPLRVGVDWVGPQTAAPQQATKLQAQLKKEGLACWLLPTDAGPAGMRVVDVRVCIWPPAKGTAPQPALPAALTGALNVLWHTSRSAKREQDQSNQPQPVDNTWHPTFTAPTAQQLGALWKQKIEHTFLAP